jgi:beta-lactamase regulating signal transducer with metallopeptidase domain
MIFILAFLLGLAGLWLIGATIGIIAGIVSHDKAVYKARREAKRRKTEPESADMWAEFDANEGDDHEVRSSRL